MSLRKEQYEEEEASQDRWLVSYADFITLMFAFFAILYATSQKDLEKSQEFQESIKRFLIKAGSFGETGGQINQGQKNTTPIEQPITTFRPEKPEAATSLDEAETFIESQLTKAEREKYILDVVSDEWGVRITIPSSALFGVNSERFREDAVPFIAKLGGLLSQSKRKVLIEGHVTAGETGNYKSTWEFASARAVNTLRFFEKREKIQADQLAVATLADSRPIYKGEKAAMNSRLEIVLLNTDMEL